MTHYERLEVNMTSNLDEIKKSYKTLAKKFHPDTPEGCEETFKLINESYSVLSDSNKRTAYDYSLRRQHSSQFNSNFNSNFGGFNNFNDMFRENLDIERTVNVTFKEAFYGSKVTVKIYSNEFHEFFLPKGIKNGTKIQIEGKGQHSKKTGRVGNLVVRVMVSPDDTVKQIDLLDIEVKQDINIFKLFRDTKTDIYLWEEKIGTVTIPKGTDTTKVIRIKGKGMKSGNFGAVGDLYVRLNVVTPDFNDLPDTLVKEINNYIGV